MQLPVSVRALLTAMTVAVLVPVLCFGGLVAWRYAQAEAARAEQQARGVARALAADIDSELHGLRAMLEVLAASAELRQGDLEGFHRQASRVLRREGVHIVLRDADGRQLVNTRLPHGAPPPPDPDGQGMGGGQAGGGQRELRRAEPWPMVSDLLAAPPAGRLTLSVSVPAPGSGGQGAAHLLSASLPASDIRRILQRQPLPAGWVAGVVDRQGVVVARSGGDGDRVEAGRRAPAAMLPQAGEEAEGAVEGWRRAVDPDGVASLGAFARLPFAGWLAIVHIPEARAAAPLRSSLLALAGFGGGLTALALGLALLVGRRITGPLGALERMAAAAARGEVPPPPPPRATVPGAALRLRETAAAGRALAAAFDAEQARAAQLRGLARAAAAIAAAHGAEERLRILAGEACAIIGVRRAVVRAAALGGGRELAVTVPPGPGGGARREGHPPAPPGRAAAAAVAEDHPSVGTGPGVAPPPGRGAASLAVPLVGRDGRDLGLVRLADKRDGEADGEFTPEDEAILVQLARLGAAAVEAAEDEARFRALVEVSPQVVWMGDARGRFTYASPYWHEFTGLTPEATAGEGWVAAVHPGDRGPALRAWRAAVAEAAAGGAGRFGLELRFRRGADGAWRWFLARGAPLRGPDGRVDRWLGVALDIDERRRAAEAVRESEAWFRALAEALPQIVWTMTAEGRTDWVNARWEEYTGAGLDAAAGDTWIGIIHPEDREGTMAVLARSLAGGEPFETRCRLRRRDGAWRWFTARALPQRDAATGRVRRWFGTCTDIDDMKRAEEELGRAKERLEVVLRGADLGTWHWDLRTGLVERNERYATMHGLRPEEIDPRRRGVDQLPLHPDDRAPMRAAMEAHLEGRTPSYEIEYRVRHRDGGHWIWVLAQGRVVERDAEGRPLIATGTALDITARKEAEERQALLMREVDHRARNALAVVQSVLRLTRVEDPRDYAAAVESRVAALARAHALLAKERWGGADLRRVAEAELAAWVGEAEGRGRAEGRGAATAARAVLRGPPVTLAPDAVQPLSMVLHELATNAAKHGALSAPGGRLDLVWSLDAATAELVLDWSESGGPPPVAAAAAGRPARRGFGSTLIEAAARGQLGGGFEWDWAPGGLHGRLRVAARHVAALRTSAPAAAGSAAAAGGAEAAAGPPPLRGRRVLVAEDEPLVALELETTLGGLGCEVVGPAATLEETLRLAGGEARLDAAVLDVNLGGRAAFPAADLLAGRGVPVIFATGYGDLPGGRVGIGGGRPGAVLLRKPLARGELEAALRRLLSPRPAGAAAAAAEDAA